MKKKLISFVVPVYNASAYLQECLDSLTKQTYANIEIIMVNDGSTDNSLEILEKNASFDKRIEVVNKKNGGVSSARNEGIKRAKGEYIIFVDGDDKVELNLIENCLKYIDDCDALRYGIYEFSDKKVVLHSAYNDVNKVLDSKDVFTDLIKGDISGHCFCFILKTEIIKKNNLYFDEELSYCEDVVFILNYLKCATKIRIIDTPLYDYRVVNTSVTRNFDNKIRNLKSLKKLRQKVKKIVNDFDEKDNYFNVYNLTLLKLLVYYYSTFAKNYKLKDFKKIIKDINNVIIEIFKDVNVDSLGKGSKIFIYLNINNHLTLLYIYLFIFNKLKW